MAVNRETWVSIIRGSQPILSLFSGYWVSQYSVSSEVSLIASFSAAEKELAELAEQEGVA